MTTRRDCLKVSLAAAIAAPIPQRLSFAADAAAGPLLTRAIPSSGEQVPLVGLGSSATFAQVARSEDVSALRGVLQALVEGGGSVFDTAPAYGASEEVAGAIARELGITDEVFWATKLNVVPRGGDKADPAQAREQIETSFRRIGKDRLDLVQVHNLADVPTQLGLLQALRKEGRVRYVGVTSTSKPAYPRLVEVMRNEEIDFIGVDYAVDNRDVEETILPLAQERKIGVLVYLPFGRTRLWERIGERPLPEWASEFDATSWAQFMIKYVAAHPAVTCVTPATSKPHHMADNLGAARGRLPDEAQRRRMVEFIDALPAAG